MVADPTSCRPLIGITADIEDDRAQLRMTYLRTAVTAGGTPIILAAPDEESADELAIHHASLCDAFILSGGDDPATEPYGEPTHAAAKRISPARQRYEAALLRELNSSAHDKPTLGVCLGMQMMALHAAGSLNQHLPDDTPTHADHEAGKLHPVKPAIAGGAIPAGEVVSRHHQAVRDPGSMRVVAVAHDGVIEAIDDPARRFYMGVQWHPERVGEGPLGLGLFEALVKAIKGTR